jgi:3-hydroxyisobutyrate dehydrogenase
VKVMNVGFIGLGKMGHGMATNLQSAGFDLVVTDLTRDAASDLLEGGAVWADSPREVAEACDVIFTSLPTPGDVESIATGPQGLRAGFKRGSAWFDLSTNDLELIRRLHAELADEGIDFLDAPVSGGPAGAASGKLAIWVGGDEGVYHRHSALLNAMGDNAAYIGPIGAATIAKLVHNLASAAINAVVSEALTLGVKAGLDPLPLYEALRAGAAGRRRSFDSVGSRFLQGRLDPPSFQLRLAHKDIGLAIQLAHTVDVPLQLCELVFGEITEAMERGWGLRDSQSFLLLQQERAGIPPFEVSAEQISDVMART